MKALIVIFIILFIILLIPVGIDGGYRKGALALSLKIGPISIRLFPRKRSRRPAKSKAPKFFHFSKKPKPDKTGISPDMLPDIVKLVLNALSHFRRKLSVDYLRILVSVGSSDPFKTAIHTAAVSSALGTLLPLVETAFEIKERDFGVSTDFFSEETRADIWLTASVHLLDLVHIAAVAGLRYLKLTSKNRQLERNEANG